MIELKFEIIQNHEILLKFKVVAISKTPPTSINMPDEARILTRSWALDE